ncbi:cation:proton antiporter [Streptomyces sp. N2-109]|uniref:Cation:proton antiporter n=1 Tax=Streptomyces gossypii TaxID=2883101 RepID=A0ABT2JQZ1_9ACTN|nr:cation:proton antiporter [Streptomyces gossypii]MCT2590309.1 cation:proton antiporter [Streptomyces gossypii]
MADIAIVLIAGAVVVRLSRRLRQPPVVAEIATGIMLGPSVLGLLPGDLPQQLFPTDARPALSVIAQVGLVFFMFLAGWELDFTRLHGRGKAVATLAGLSMAVPFALGAGAAALLFDRYGGGDVQLSTFILFLSTAFSITAFPVLARIIKDGGLSGTKVGTMAMACAAIGDVLAWCVLVLVVAVSQADGAGRFVAVLALTVAYALLMACVVRPLLRTLISRSARSSRPVAGGMYLALIASGVFLSAWVTSWIGIHAIFGAFAFGLAMPRTVSREVHEHVAAPLSKIVSLLLPVFFIVTGLTVDLGTLAPSGLLILLFLLAVAVVGKLAGAGLPARMSGMSWREAGAFGILMNTRGLTELVVLDIGRQLGVINADMFTMMVILAVVTTAMAGPALQLLGVTAQPSAPEAPLANPDTIPPVTGPVPDPVP